MLPAAILLIGVVASVLFIRHGAGAPAQPEKERVEVDSVAS